jgi:hypothetical protein
MAWPSKCTEYIYFKVYPRILAYNRKSNILLTSVSEIQLTLFTGVLYVLQRYQVHLCSARFQIGLLSQGNKKFICDLGSTERQQDTAIHRQTTGHSTGLAIPNKDCTEDRIVGILHSKGK